MYGKKIYDKEQRKKLAIVKVVIAEAPERK